MHQHFYVNSPITVELHDLIANQLINNAEISELTVYLSSGGGNPFTGHNLYTLMKSLDFPTTIYNMGSVDSAAVQFFLGFQRRYATAHATFMVHQTKFTRDLLPPMYTRFDLLTALRELEAMEHKTEQVIFTETSQRATRDIKLQDISSAIFHTTVSNAERALEFGFVDGIQHPIIPKQNVIYLTEDSISSWKKR